MPEEQIKTLFAMQKKQFDLLNDLHNKVDGLSGNSECEPLDKDKTNVAFANVAFYYYNHKSSKDMFIKLSPLPFTLTVNRYVLATRIGTGTFEGVVYKENGDTTHITDGRFMVKLK